MNLPLPTCEFCGATYWEPHGAQHEPDCWKHPGMGADVHHTAIIEPGVHFGYRPTVGYYSIVRGDVQIGNDFRLGSHSSVEGRVTIGDDVTIRGKCEIPNSVIGDRVSIYSGVKFYDTPRPPDGQNLPPTIEDDVIIGCDAAILGGVTIGRGCFVGARCFITHNMLPGMMALVSYLAPTGYSVQPRVSL